MSALTEAAKGKDCTVRLYPHCNNNPETTVFAHAPSEDKCTSKKSPDWWGAYACSSCHDIVDGRKFISWPKHEIEAAFVEGVFRTLKNRIEEGLIVVEGLS